jgi:glucose-1-phosphate cytidylyltransferase
MKDPANIPVFLPCGGLGTRIKEETEFRLKPMVPIGEHPVPWHVMQIYARHGFRRFVLRLDFKAEVVKDYFRHFHLRNAGSAIKFKINFSNGCRKTRPVCSNANRW